MKYAPVSLMNAPTSGARASAAPASRSSARLAKPAGRSVAERIPAASVAKPSCFSLPCVKIAVKKP